MGEDITFSIFWGLVGFIFRLVTIDTNFIFFYGYCYLFYLTYDLEFKLVLLVLQKLKNYHHKNIECVIILNF